MEKGKVIAWTTFAANMLIAFHFAVLMSCTIIYLLFRFIFQIEAPHPWIILTSVFILLLVLLFLWGRYQFRLIMVNESISRERFRNVLILAGIVLTACICIFGFVIQQKNTKSNYALMRVAIMKVLQPGCMLEIPGKKQIPVPEQDISVLWESVQFNKFISPGKMIAIAVVSSPSGDKFYLSENPESGAAIITCRDKTAVLRKTPAEIKKILEEISSSSMKSASGPAAD